jgi:hypothetical protein
VSDVVIKRFSAEHEYREAAFSACETYRYYLLIAWSAHGELCNFIGLNPSTATERVDDPTIRKCRDFASRWGYRGIIMTNLFAWRATDPRAMKRAASPIGLFNDEYLLASAKQCRKIIAAWGNDGLHTDRDAAVGLMLTAAGLYLYCLKLTGQNAPYHPLYVPYTAVPEIYGIPGSNRKATT